MTNLSTKVFGRLTAIERAPDQVSKSGNRSAQWRCVCECGKSLCVLAGNLRSGRTTSCGCYHKEVVTRHGFTNNPAFKVWAGMVSRCYDPGSNGYKEYGAVGITVCDKWHSSFAAFLEDMGPRPSMEHTLDRRDGSRNYTPDNCRWATRFVQANNKKSVRHFVLFGVVANLQDWARHIGITRHAIVARMERHGESAEFAIRHYLARLDPIFA